LFVLLQKTAGMAVAGAMEAANGGKWVVGLAGELLSCKCSV